MWKAREAAMAVQGKMVDLQRKKGKGLQCLESAMCGFFFSKIDFRTTIIIKDEISSLDNSSIFRVRTQRCLVLATWI